MMSSIAPEAKMLAEAVARNAAVVLSLPSAGMLRHHKSRFLGEQAGALWVQGVAEEAELLEQLIAAARPVGVTLRRGEAKIQFAAAPLRREQEFALQAGTRVEAWLLSAPDSVRVVQRRGHYRVRAGGSVPLEVRLWRLLEQSPLADLPPQHMELPAALWDISVGGIGVLLKRAGEPVPVVDERLRVELCSDDLALLPQPLLLEGRIRFVFAGGEGSHPRLGIQFVNLQGDLAGRSSQAALEKIVGWLEREQLRRARRPLRPAG